MQVGEVENAQRLPQPEGQLHLRGRNIELAWLDAAGITCGCNACASQGREKLPACEFKHE